MTWLETSTENCTVQRTLDVVGEKWTLLVLRDVMNGVQRFDDFHRHVGLSETVLADRLRKLVAAGILKAVPYQEPGRRTRREYRLTAKGWDLWPVMEALRQWGNHYTADPEGPPLEVLHECGAPLATAVVCTAGHGPVAPKQVMTRPGPSAKPFSEPADAPTAASTAAPTAGGGHD